MINGELPQGGYQVTMYSGNTDRLMKRFDSYTYMCDAQEDFKTWYVKKFGFKPDWSIADHQTLTCWAGNLSFYMERVR